jgi:hypothetical protein
VLAENMGDSIRPEPRPFRIDDLKHLANLRSIGFVWDLNNQYRQHFGLASHIAVVVPANLKLTNSFNRVAQ